MIPVYVGFVLLVLVLVTLDLKLLHRRDSEVTMGTALKWVAVWVGLGLAFNVAIYFMYEHHWRGLGKAPNVVLTGGQAAIQFLTAYLVEESLSVDNMFVFAVIFNYFRVPLKYQHRVLFWGIVGALVMRGVMIAIGTALIQSLDWIIYVFGGILLWTAWKMFRSGEDSVEPMKNPMVKLARRLIPMSEDYHEDRFTTIIDGRKYATPLFIVLLVIESTDVLFAVDSIPAVFGVTHDPFIVFTSNIFAILGLRALYFALAGVLDSFKYLKTALVVLLAFIGVKMLASGHYHMPPLVSLGIVFAILGTGIGASIWAGRTKP